MKAGRRGAGVAEPEVEGRLDGAEVKRSWRSESLSSSVSLSEAEDEGLVR